MKRLLLAPLQPAALLALGVLLGRAAQADTTLDFNSLPAGQANNSPILAGFGSYAAISANGISVTGSGTPNIGLAWQATGGRWDYYTDAVWTAAQLDGSAAGSLHEVIFTPAVWAAVVLKSVNLHPYYDSTERYTYEISVVSGLNTLASLTTTFRADATRSHPVSLNSTGGIGQAVTLRFRRLASTLGAGETEGGTQNIAIDDLVLDQSGIPPVDLGPFVRFTGVSNAVVVWQTASNQPSILEFGESSPSGTRLVDGAPKINHSLALSGLKPRTKYSFVVKQLVNGQESPSAVYEFETDFNYSVTPPPPGPSPFPDDANSAFITTVAQAILAQTGVTQGYALDYGAADGRLAYELVRRSDLNVFLVSSNATVVATARRRLQAAGVYGSRVTALQAPLAQLPYTKDWFNLVVSSELLLGPNVPGSAPELFRVLRPSGGVALLGLPSGVSGSLPQWAVLDSWARNGIAPTNATIESDFNRATLITRAPLPGAGQWSHNFGDAGQTTCSGDQRVLGRGMKVQWFGEPGPRAFTDRQARNPTPLTVNGILFTQGNNRLAAQDAYNGKIYWSMEVPDLRRVNMPRDGGNWCADDTSLYVAHRDTLWRVANTTGELTQSYRVQANPANYDWGYVASVGDRLYGSSVKKNSFYTKFDGSWEFWYDSTSALNEIGKICSDNLFSLDKSTGQPLWTYTNGTVINSSIAIGGGRVYFVDCRNPAIRAYGSGRIDNTGLWQNNYMVALDAVTGALLWERPLSVPTSPYPAVFYLCYAGGKLVLNSSTTQYNVFAYSATNGAQLWTRTHAWNRNHHGGHMYHPVIVGNLVIVEPFAYDLNTGAVAKSGLPVRGGCTTLSAAANTVHYINWDYSIGSPYFWDLDTDQRRQMAGTRSSCWLSVISGGGMVLMPAASAGCACRFPIQSTISFAAP